MNITNNQKFKDARLSNYGEGTEVSRRTYNLIIAGTVVWGFILNYLEATFFQSFILSIHPIIMLIAYLAVSIPAIIIIHKSSNPVTSFLAFTLLALAMGMLITNIISFYAHETVTKAFLETGIVCLVVGSLATLFPNFFAKLGRGLFISLIVMIIVEMIVMLIFRSSPQIISILMVILFSGFFGYDMVKSQSYVPSIDNAIDSAADIYVDVINIFIRLLEAFGER